MLSPLFINKLALPNLATITQYPALTVGLSVFTFLLLVIDLCSNQALSQKFSLYPNAPFEFDLNRLSFYLLFHRGFTHWLLNVVGLFSPLAIFERTNGTVFTGVTLNVLAVTAGLQFCIVGKLLYPNTQVIGLSGVVFLFMSFMAYKEHHTTPVIYTFKYQGSEVSIPTLYSPFIFLIVCMVLIPGSSFWGHLAGISSGYLLALGYIKFLYPPLKAILFIERKLQTPINALRSLVVYYKEEEAIEQRGVSYNPLLSSDPESALNDIPVTTGARTNSFAGEGQVLGAT
jgi:membrane associated rhomboid family serine protease